jgi:lipoprotein-anchoring transpeptidase ErfK/SrfK
VPAPAAPETTALPFRAALAVQILLDRENLSGGCADGIIGPQTRLALKAWQRKHGLPATGEPDAATLDALGDLERVYTTHTVTAEEEAELTPIPETWRGKAQMERLGYETIRETLAEAAHTSQRALERLNPDVEWPNPPTGTELTVPDPTAERVPKAALVTISLHAKLVRAYDTNDALIALFPCSIAQLAEKRPVGDLKVTRCARDPNFIFDPAVFVESEEAQTIAGKLLIPPGPNNPVGAAWIGLDRPGYGLHGTPRPEDIGKTESHGCFRLANWNARKLLRMISLDLPVRVEP